MLFFSETLVCPNDNDMIMIREGPPPLEVTYSILEEAKCTYDSGTSFNDGQHDITCKRDNDECTFTVTVLGITYLLIICVCCYYLFCLYNEMNTFDFFRYILSNLVR